MLVHFFLLGFNFEGGCCYYPNVNAVLIVSAARTRKYRLEILHSSLVLANLLSYLYVVLTEDNFH